MKENPKHITENFCINCKWYECRKYPDYGEIHVCLNNEPKLFKTNVAKPDGWCILHEYDINKKNQKRGKL